MRKVYPQEICKQGMKAGRRNKGPKWNIPIAKGSEVQSGLLQMETGFPESLFCSCPLTS